MKWSVSFRNTWLLFLCGPKYILTQLYHGGNVQWIWKLTLTSSIKLIPQHGTFSVDKFYFEPAVLEVQVPMQCVCVCDVTVIVEMSPVPRGIGCWACGGITQWCQRGWYFSQTDSQGSLFCENCSSEALQCLPWAAALSRVAATAPFDVPWVGDSAGLWAVVTAAGTKTTILWRIVWIFSLKHLWTPNVSLEPKFYEKPACVLLKLERHESI